MSRGPKSLGLAALVAAAITAAPAQAAVSIHAGTFCRPISDGTTGMVYTEAGIYTGNASAQLVCPLSGYDFNQVFGDAGVFYRHQSSATTTASYYVSGLSLGGALVKSTTKTTSGSGSSSTYKLFVLGSPILPTASYMSVSLRVSAPTNFTVGGYYVTLP